MSLQQRQPFAERGEYVASKNFRFAGRQFNAGDDFPWRSLACSARRLRQLYEGRFIGFKAGEIPAGEATDEVADTAEAAAPETSVEVESSEPEEEPDDDELITIFDPSVHEIIRTDDRKCYIGLDGAVLLEITRREAKRLSTAEEPTDINMDAVIRG